LKEFANRVTPSANGVAAHVITAKAGDSIKPEARAPGSITGNEESPQRGRQRNILFDCRPLRRL